MERRARAQLARYLNLAHIMTVISADAQSRHFPTTKGIKYGLAKLMNSSACTGGGNRRNLDQVDDDTYRGNHYDVAGNPTPTREGSRSTKSDPKSPSFGGPTYAGDTGHEGLDPISSPYQRAAYASRVSGDNTIPGDTPPRREEGGLFTEPHQMNDPYDDDDGGGGGRRRRRRGDRYRNRDGGDGDGDGGPPRPLQRTAFGKSSVRDIGMADLYEEGLVSLDEWELIERGQELGIPAYMLPLQWLMRLIQICRTNQLLLNGDQSVSQLQGKVTELIKQCSGIFSSIQAQLPYPYVALVSLTAHFYLLSLATYLGMLLYDGDLTVPNGPLFGPLTTSFVYLYLAFANALIQGLLDIHTITDNLFGRGPARFPLRATITSIINTSQGLLAVSASGLGEDEDEEEEEEEEEEGDGDEEHANDNSMSAMGATHSHYRDNIGDVDSIIGITPEAMKGGQGGGAAGGGGDGGGLTTASHDHEASSRHTSPDRGTSSSGGGGFSPTGTTTTSTGVRRSGSTRTSPTKDGVKDGVGVGVGVGLISTTHGTSNPGFGSVAGSPERAVLRGTSSSSSSPRSRILHDRADVVGAAAAASVVAPLNHLPVMGAGAGVDRDLFHPATPSAVLARQGSTGRHHHHHHGQETSLMRGVARGVQFASILGPRAGGAGGLARRSAEMTTMLPATPTRAVRRGGGDAREEGIEEGDEGGVS